MVIRYLTDGIQSSASARVYKHVIVFNLYKKLLQEVGTLGQDVENIHEQVDDND